jgi:hypothetical protein
MRVDEAAGAGARAPDPAAGHAHGLPRGGTPSRAPPPSPPPQSAYRKPAAKAVDKKKFELTEEQKQEIREAFDLFDTDGSGACRGGCAACP